MSEVGFDEAAIGLAVLSWNLLTPSMGQMRSLSPGWMALIWLRNAALLTLAVIGVLTLALDPQHHHHIHIFTTAFKCISIIPKNLHYFCFRQPIGGMAGIA